MSFALSTAVDSNKVFLVQSCELEGRLDPHFHKPEFKVIEERIATSGWESFALKRLFQINRGGSPRPIQKYLTDDPGGFNWIKIGDTQGVDKYITHTKQKIRPEGAKYSRKVMPGDFILSNSMSFGKPFLMKIEGYIHDGWLLFHMVTGKATKEYLHIVLGANFIYQLFRKHTIGGVVENLNIDLVKSIQIPVPPKEVQAQIVAKMNATYAAKKHKEDQAQQLLKSIDEYLLGELGITLPEQQDTSLQSRMFIRQWNEISGGRFDPFFGSLNKQDKSGKYPFYRLKTLAHISKGDSITSEDVIAGNIPVIAGGQTSPYNHNVANNEGNIITISASGAYAGYVWYHEHPVFASDCTMVSSFDANKLSNKYLFEYLRLEQQNIYSIQQGSGQPHVYSSDLATLTVPLPRLEKQTEIVNHITNIRNQAKALQQQAQTDVAQAKKEVELMILDEAAYMSCP